MPQGDRSSGGAIFNAEFAQDTLGVLALRIKLIS
jgi:hypothetical protein